MKFGLVFFFMILQDRPLLPTSYKWPKITNGFPWGEILTPSLRFFNGFYLAGVLGWFSWTLGSMIRINSLFHPPYKLGYSLGSYITHLLYNHLIHPQTKRDHPRYLKGVFFVPAPKTPIFPPNRFVMFRSFAMLVQVKPGGSSCWVGFFPVANPMGCNNSP